MLVDVIILWRPNTKYSKFTSTELKGSEKTIFKYIAYP